VNDKRNVLILGDVVERPMARRQERVGGEGRVNEIPLEARKTPREMARNMFEEMLPAGQELN
jgi:hypothetical protein